jgi:hypothetical protein
MSLSLSGRCDLKNTHNLLGKTVNSHIVISIEVQKIKDKILNNYLVPVYTKQWDKLNENMFFCERLKKKLVNYQNTYKLDELKSYIETLKVIEILYDKFKSVEKEGGISISNSKKSELASIVYKTHMIRLLPEYELYDSIIGKPNRQLNEKYNQDVIQFIKSLLLIDDIEYNTIKGEIEKKIPNIIIKK